jgi:hypothetical protein
MFVNHKTLLISQTEIEGMRFQPGTNITPRDSVMSDPDDPMDPPMYSRRPYLETMTQMAEWEQIRRIPKDEVVKVIESAGLGMNESSLVQTKSGQGWVWSDMFEAR